MDEIETFSVHHKFGTCEFFSVSQYGQVVGAFEVFTRTKVFEWLFALDADGRAGRKRTFL